MFYLMDVFTYLSQGTSGLLNMVKRLLSGKLVEQITNIDDFLDYDGILRALGECYFINQTYSNNKNCQISFKYEQFLA